MQFNVQINCDNSMFKAEESENDDIATAVELEALLRRLRINITKEPRVLSRTEDNPFIIHDTNGARVGTAWFGDE